MSPSQRVVSAGLPEETLGRASRPRRRPAETIGKDETALDGRLWGLNRRVLARVDHLPHARGDLMWCVVLRPRGDMRLIFGSPPGATPGACRGAHRHARGDFEPKISVFETVGKGHRHQRRGHARIGPCGWTDRSSSRSTGAAIQAYVPAHPLRDERKMLVESFLARMEVSPTKNTGAACFATLPADVGNLSFQMVAGA